ncbi:MAG: hypothetical protein JW910_16990 [Anaerolineae bacterium]|nr:hypothetical protein [Anaerolineae bacterium]
MEIELTRLGKHSLVVGAPIMPAAGTFGYGDRYHKLLKVEKFGAIVTDPVTYPPRRTNKKPHVVPLPGGMLLTSGLPNPGARNVVKTYQGTWSNLPVPVIVHVWGATPPEVRRCVRAITACPDVAGIELGIHDNSSADEVYAYIQAVLETTQLPLLVRLPLERAVELAPVVAVSDAGAVVVGAPPRGTGRDPVTGQMVSGRIFGPLVKPLAVRTVEQVVRQVERDALPVIGAGGIHSVQDARDFIEVGARAVQVDSVLWVRPKQAEIIARNLGGLELTRASNAYPDEWFPGMGITNQHEQIPPPPEDLPE